MTAPNPPNATLLIVSIIAALFCAVLIVLLKPLLQRYALARPNARSSHAVPTPQGAGIAVITATLLAAVSCMSLLDLAFPGPLFAATIFIALVGLADDIRPIAVVPRLLLQAVAVAAVIFTLPAELRIAPALPLLVERTLIMLAGLWFVNLVNFMDGLDWMTAAELVPITGAMILLGLLGEFPALPVIIAAALFGATLGFAPFNRPVAKVFLGDVGSLPIGLLLGWLLLQLALRQQLAAALLLPLYYLTDATVTLLRRLARGDEFWAAHRSHFYQRATDNGHTVIRVVTNVFVLNLALAALAIAAVKSASTMSAALALLAGMTIVVLTLYSFRRRRSS